MTSRLQARLLAQRALFQRLQSSKKRNKLQAGFTLIELLIVVIIIGILAAIAIPAFLNQRERADQAASDAAASSLARKCSTAVTTGDASFVPTAAEVTAAALTTATCTGTPPSAGTYTTPEGRTWTVNSDGRIVSP